MRLSSVYNSQNGTYIAQLHQYLRPIFFQYHIKGHSVYEGCLRTIEINAPICYSKRAILLMLDCFEYIAEAFLPV